MVGTGQKHYLEGAREGELLWYVAPKCSAKASTDYGEQAVPIFFVSFAGALTPTAILIHLSFCCIKTLPSNASSTDG